MKNLLRTCLIFFFFLSSFNIFSSYITRKEATMILIEKLSLLENLLLSINEYYKILDKEIEKKDKLFESKFLFEEKKEEIYSSITKIKIKEDIKKAISLLNKAIESNDINKMISSIRHQNYHLSFQIWQEIEKLNENLGDLNTETLLSTYQQHLTILEEKMLKALIIFNRKQNDLEKKQEDTNSKIKNLEKRLNQITGEESRVKLYKYFKHKVGNNANDFKHIEYFYEFMVRELVSFRVSSAAISSGEVNGDDSMITFGREVTLAGLYGLEYVGEQIPFGSLVTHTLSAIGFYLISANQSAENESYYYSMESMIYSESFARQSALQICLSIDLKQLLTKNKSKVQSIAKTYVGIWRKQVFKLIKKNMIEPLNLENVVSVDTLTDNINMCHRKMIETISKSFHKKINKENLKNKATKYFNGIRNTYRDTIDSLENTSVSSESSN